MTFISFEYIQFFRFLKRVLSQILSIFSAIFSFEPSYLGQIDILKMESCSKSVLECSFKKILLYRNSIGHFSNFAKPWPNVNSFIEFRMLIILNIVFRYSIYKYPDQIIMLMSELKETLWSKLLIKRVMLIIKSPYRDSSLLT